MLLIGTAAKFALRTAALQIVASKLRTTAEHHRQGARVYVYGYGFGRIEREPYTMLVDLILSSPMDDLRVVDVALDGDGQRVNIPLDDVVDATAARQTLHALSKDKRIVMGRPGDDEHELRQRARSAGLRVVRGIPKRTVHDAADG